MRNRALLSKDETEIALEMWWTSGWNTNEIARFLFAPEAAVARTIQAARDIIRMEHRERSAGP